MTSAAVIMVAVFSLFGTLRMISMKQMGVGLGLAVSYGIIEAHGGDIEVRSMVGEGTTFTVSLPLEQHQAPAEPPVAVLMHRE